MLDTQAKAFTAALQSNGNNRQPGSKGWRNKAPQNGQSETIERNGKKYYWCAKHRFWSPTHGTANCLKGKKDENNTSNEPSLSINLADQSIEIPNDYGIMLATSDVTSMHQ
jgi:hypothetical protein